MNVHVKQLQNFRVLVGNVILYMSEYKIVSGCTLSEQGTASGAGTVTACFPKESRITLKGKLPPSVDMMYLARELDVVLHSGVTRALLLGGLSFYGARLIGYTFSEGEDFPELTLLFYSSDPFLRSDKA